MNNLKIISRINQEKAAKHFNLQPGDVLHHIDPSWKYEDPERYAQWNPEDLVVMTRAEHARLHQTGNTNVRGKHWTLSEETRIRQSKAKQGIKFTEEHKRKLSEAHKGKHKICREDGTYYYA